MFKAYRKDVELVAHGAHVDAAGVVWARESGIVRVEVELKRRLLDELGLRELGDITQEKLEDAYTRQTEILRRVDRSDEPDILGEIPARSRMVAAAWMAGKEVKGLLSNGTLYRHAKILREYGIDILTARSVVNFPVKVRVVDLEPVGIPDWYSLKCVNS